jgi:uncharacterized membrane protein HdeD (DUF308 family)
LRLGVSLLTTTLFTAGLSLILYTFNYIEIVTAIGIILSVNGIVTILYSVFSRHLYSRLYTFGWGAIVTVAGLFMIAMQYVEFSAGLPLFIGIVLIILGVVVIVNEVSKL